MGFSVTGTHVIFFIASIIVAGSVSGIFIAVTLDTSNSLVDWGNRVQDQLDIDFEIISDPDNIPLSGANRVFYLKNIGGKKLSTTTSTFHVFIDGEIIASADYSFGDSSISVAEVTELNIASSEISAGDHTLRVVGPQAVEDEFTFTI